MVPWTEYSKRHIFSSTEDSGRAHYIKGAGLIFLLVLVSLTRQLKVVPVFFLTFMIYFRVSRKEEGNGDLSVQETLAVVA